MQDLKIFEIKCNKIPISALPAGTKEPRLLTEFVKINPNHPNIKSLMANFKFRTAGVMHPRDLQELQKIENRLQLNKNDMGLKQEYEECLKKCVCLELVQIKDFISNHGEASQPDGYSAADQTAQAMPTGPSSGNSSSMFLEMRTRRTGSSASINKLSSQILFVG